jgi:hypothetical protein
MLVNAEEARRRDCLHTDWVDHHHRPVPPSGVVGVACLLCNLQEVRRAVTFDSGRQRAAPGGDAQSLGLGKRFHDSIVEAWRLGLPAKQRN